VRFTTSHPKDFNQDIVEAMAKYGDKICDYVHLPVQSGSDRILKEMNRKYTRQEYLQKIDMIRQALPEAVVSSDFIVGFPGETEKDFAATVDIVTEVGYESIFAFKYSPRPFTKAASFEDQLSDAVKAERLNTLLEAHDQIARERAKVIEGKVYPVLVEGVDRKGQGSLSGRTTQNRIAVFPAPESKKEEMIGAIVPVKIVKAFPQTLHGELIDENS
jgi:tRNA-2-methylthio-N6-dimethylallyladenosine synthase